MRYDNDPERKRRLQRSHPFRGIRIFNITGSKWKILVGKKPMDDDRLALQIADDEDYWFQSDRGGNCVIACHPERPYVIPGDIFKIAGGVAVYYSRSRKDGKGNVRVAKASRLFKKPDDSPGFLSLDCEWIHEPITEFTCLDPFEFPAFGLNPADRKLDTGFWTDDDRLLDRIISDYDYMSDPVYKDFMSSMNPFHELNFNSNISDNDDGRYSEF